MQQALGTDKVVPAAVLLTLFCAVVDAAQPSDPLSRGEATERETIIITPLAPHYLYEGQRQLNRLRESLPELGGNSPVSGVIEQLRKLYEARKDPNSLDPFQQDMLLRALGERENP